MLDSARAIKYADPENYNVLVTNGYINEEALKLMLQYIDALNVDLKCFDDKIYRKYLKGSLEPVKRTIQLSIESNLHVEVTTLIVPTINDDLDMLEKNLFGCQAYQKTYPPFIYLDIIPHISLINQLRTFLFGRGI